MGIYTRGGGGLKFNGRLRAIRMIYFIFAIGGCIGAGVACHGSAEEIGAVNELVKFIWTVIFFL